MGLKIRQCIICGNDFNPRGGKQKTCEEHIGLAKFTCATCGKDYIAQRDSNRKYCFECKSAPRKCPVCSKIFKPDPEAKVIATYCSTACSHRARYLKNYEKKGYSQAGEDNNAWKNGTGYYKQAAFKHYGRFCTRCGTKRNLCVHHRNRDRGDNEMTNLEVLCRSCHAKEHKLAENFTHPGFKA